MAVDKRIEVEIVLRDTVSLTLKVIADNLEKANQALGKSQEKVSESGGDAFKKIKEATEGTRKTTEEGAKNTEETAERMIPLATRLSGPLTRLALGAYAVQKIGEALTGEAQKRLDMKALVEDTNFDKDFISVLKQAQDRKGIASGEAEQNIRTFGAALQETAYGKGGILTKELDKINEGALATRIEELTGGGKQREAAMAVFNRFHELSKIDTEESKKQALLLARAFQLAPSFFKDMSSDQLAIIKPAIDIQIEVATTYFGRWQTMLTLLENAWKFTLNLGTVALNRSFDILGTLTDYNATFDPAARKEAGLPPIATPAELEAFKKRNEVSFGLLKEILSILQGVQNKESIEKRWVGGPVLPGRIYEVAEKGPETFRSNAGWLEMLEPKRKGPRFFIPPTGGEIMPGARPADPMDDPWGGRRTIPPGEFDEEDKPRRLPGDMFMDWGQLWTPFEKRFGSWPGQRYDPEQGMVEHPRAGSTPEENWEALNKGLRGPWAKGVGEIEGETIPEWNPEKPTRFDLQQTQRGMEQQLKLPWDQVPPDHPGYYSSRPNQQFPISFDPENFRRDMDEELRGPDPGSLGAQIIFKNVPEGVETNAEGDGFDNFTVNKTRQLQSI